MIVVSNTTPLCYLTLIGHAEVLPKLYGNIHTTVTVIAELCHPRAPGPVRDWATSPPGWVRVHPDPNDADPDFSALDPGERTALFLCGRLRSDVVLLDEAAARAIAVQRGLKVSGTLGILGDAAQLGFLNLPAALDLLRKTNFRASPELWKALYSRRIVPKTGRKKICEKSLPKEMFGLIFSQDGRNIG